MKQLISAILLAAAIALPCAAQTNTNETPQTFFMSVQQYFTSFNTNLANTFATDRVNVSIGSVTVGNSQLAADLKLEYRFSTNSGFGLDADIRNTTVAGTVLSYQGGLSYSIVHVDAKFTGYLDAGYKTDVNLPYIAPGVMVKKALTDNTFAGVYLELPIYFSHSSGPVAPTYGVFTGFKL